MTKLLSAGQELLPDSGAVIDPVVDDLVAALQEGEELRIAQATLNVGAAMVRAYDATDPAEIPISVRSKFMVELDWTPYARARLEKYVEAHPDTEEVVRGSLFFAKDAKTLRMLGRVISAQAPQHG